MYGYWDYTNGPEKCLDIDKECRADAEERIESTWAFTLIVSSLSSIFIALFLICGCYSKSICCFKGRSGKGSLLSKKTFYSVKSMKR